MHDDRASIAKIARPRLTGTVARDRLFRLMDSSRERPVIWIAAPGGSGKTTLVANWLDNRKLPVLWYQVDEGDGDLATFFHYMGLAGRRAVPARKKSLPALTPEYLSGIAVFTRRFFEDLFGRLLSLRSGRSASHGPVLVLDNFQDAPSGSPFSEMIVHGLDAVPEGLTVLVISRSEPPPQLARLRANDRIGLIGWQDIKLTKDEAREIVQAHGVKDLNAGALNEIYQQTDGWAAGLAALRDHLRAGRELGIFNLSCWRTRVMLPIYARALEAGIEVEHVQAIIAKRGLKPDASVMEIENWPWPVKVHTLGRFSLFKDGKPVAFPRKVQKKTLEFLKAAIALGGEEVREEQIIDPRSLRHPVAIISSNMKKPGPTAWPAPARIQTTRFCRALTFIMSCSYSSAFSMSSFPPARSSCNFRLFAVPSAVLSGVF